MLKDINISIRLFGAFRKFHAAAISLTLPEGASVADVKLALGQALEHINPEFKDFELLEKSALADDKAVLNATDLLHRDAQLAILPPVCGG